MEACLDFISMANVTCREEKAPRADELKCNEGCCATVSAGISNRGGGHWDEISNSEFMGD
jgi:hypothetical protein